MEVSSHGLDQHRTAGVDFRCMNWGYEDGRIRVEDPERYPLQLYEAVVEGIPLAGRTLVDISCGRGGGLAHLHGSHGPAEAIGVDFTEGNVRACRRGRWSSNR